MLNANLKSVKKYNNSILRVLTKDFILIDQVLVSASNFLFTIYLAKLLSASDFNIFAAVYIVYLFISSIQSSIFIAPLYAIENIGLNRNIFNELRIFHFIFLTIVLSILFFSHNIIIETLNISTSCGIIFKLVFALLNIEFYRRILLKVNNAYILLYDSIFYILVPILFCYYGLNLSELSTIYFMSTVLVIVAVILKYQIKFTIKHFDKTKFMLYWNFSKWLLYSAVLQFISGNYVAIYAAGVVGSGIYGIVRVFQNIQGLFNVTLQYLDTKLSVSLPALKPRYLYRTVRKRITIILSLSFSIFALMHLLGLKSIVSFLYNDDYIEYGYIINYVFLLYLLSLTNVVFRNILKVRLKTSPVLFSGIVSSVLVLIMLRMYNESWGVDGYYLVNVIPLIGATITYILWLIRSNRENSLA